MGHGFARATVCLAVLVSTLPDVAQAFDIVSSGQARTKIVIPDRATPVVVFAAGELQYHIARASGVKLDVVEESKSPDSSGLIYLGPCRKTAATQVLGPKLPANGFVIKLAANSLFLAGDDSDGVPTWILHNNRERVGTLFAVYEFLEKHLSVCWLWPGELGTVVPQQLDIAVDTWDQTGAPRLIHARWRDGGPVVAGSSGWASTQARSKYLNDQSIWLRRHRFALGVNLDIHHAFTGWWDKYHQEHPEYFNLLPDGTRRPDPTYWGGSPKLVSMCLSEPSLWKAIVKHWQETRTPQYSCIDASENDTPGKCTCSRCLAWDVPDASSNATFEERLESARQAFEKGQKNWEESLGPLSDRYARFYLAVQREAQKVDPDAVVLGFAYSNYRQPPVKTRLNDHIIIGIVPGIGFPWTDEKRQAFRRQWDGWRASGARLLLRPNYMLYGHNLPIFLARAIGEDFSYAARRGMIGTDFDSLTGQWSTQGPNLYMLARLHEHPEMSVDEVLDEYYAGFGSAKGAVRAYFAHWENVTNELAGKAVADFRYNTFYREAHSIFTPAVLATGRELLAKAEKAAAGNELALRRVAFLKDGLTNAELTLAVQPAYQAYREQGNLSGYRQAIEQLDTHRRRIETANVANMSFLAWAERYTWDRAPMEPTVKPAAGATPQSSPPVPAAKNLVANGGFEQPGKHWARSQMCGQFEFAFDPAQAHHGKLSGRLSCTRLEPQEPQAGWTRCWGRWYQPKLPVQPGKTYRLRFWVKTSDVFGGRVAIWVTGDSKEGTKTASVYHTDGQWRQVVIDGIVPAGKQVALYFNLMAGVGTVWFDDVELSQVQ